MPHKGKRDMATGDVQVTLVGNTTGEPELRYLSSGAAVCSFTVAVQPRRFNKNTNQWEDGQASFYRCSAWRQLAENIAESFTKGSRVIVTGTIGQRSYETREGEQRTVFEVQVDDIGASVKFATATIKRPERTGGQAPQQAQRPQQVPDDPWSTPTQQRPAQPQQAAFDASDPWGSPPPQPAGAGGYDQPPPF